MRGRVVVGMRVVVGGDNCHQDVAMHINIVVFQNVKIVKTCCLS